MVGLFSSDDTDDETDQKRCKTCGQLKDKDQFWKYGICNECGQSTWMQKCPKCGSTSIMSETKENPKGYRTFSPGTITIWECENCGFRSGARHDWRWV